MSTPFSRLPRLLRTTLSLGGGLLPSLRLALHVLRTEGAHGIAWRVRNAGQIADGRVDVWRHFFVDGSADKPFPVERMEQLWSGADDSLLVDLHALLDHHNRLLAEAAAWTLGRWYAREDQWPEVEAILESALPAYESRLSALPLGIKLLWADTLRHQGRHQHAWQWLDTLDAIGAGPTWPADLTLARANLVRPAQNRVSTQPEAIKRWLDVVNHGLKAKGLAHVRLTTPEAGADFDNLEAEACQPVTDGPLVSVIVPVYNAARTLSTTLRGLSAQSWEAMEILVVDDCSTDETVAIAKAHAAGDSRIKLLRQPQNGGAYATRNAGAQQAQGEFITVHDSDDWSHPQKIELQVNALVGQPQKLVSFSHWARATQELEFGGWHSHENWGAWIIRNTSSLLMRRTAFERLGYWDQVRCSADTEYYYRAIRVFGAQAIVEVMPGIPLSLGRVTPDSLTQSSDTHIFTLFGGLRKQYHDAFEEWHQSFDSSTPFSLHLELQPATRPFPVPEEMIRTTKS